MIKIIKVNNKLVGTNRIEQSKLEKLSNNKSYILTSETTSDKSIALIKSNGRIKFYSQLDEDNTRSYKDGTTFTATPHPDNRSWKQLATFHSVCKYASEHYSEDSNLNTPAKVKEILKIQCKFVNYYTYYTNKKTGEETLHIKTKSLSYVNCDHQDATEFIDQAINLMANWLQVSVDDLLMNSKGFTVNKKIED